MIMNGLAQELINNLAKRNIDALYCNNALEATEKILGFIPVDASIGISGSKTLAELGLVERLKARGNTVFDQYSPGIDKNESVRLRQLGAGADYYLTSANAVSKDGELVFLSAWGHRIAGIANARRVICVCGINKITPDLNSALKRAKEYATPLNYKRLNWDSKKRMVCQVLAIEGEIITGRLTVFLVAESLGF